MTIFWYGFVQKAKAKTKQIYKPAQTSSTFDRIAFHVQRNQECLFRLFVSLHNWNANLKNFTTAGRDKG